MNANDLKRNLAKLWKDTFNDSDQYISLIFNNNFYPEYAQFEEVDGEIVAGLIGVPYSFGNADCNIKALYLCGLATKPQYRARGIMTRLLNAVNEKARNDGFAFTFLIPADPGLSKYYRDRDYVNAFYRVVDNYTSLHDFDREYESILDEQKEKVADLKRNRYRSLKTGVYDPAAENASIIKKEMIKMIRSIEDVQQDLQILHTDKDLEVIIEENCVSGGSISYVTNSSGTISAVAFTTQNESTVSIHKLYTTDIASKYKVLCAIKTLNPEKGIRHYVSSIEMDRVALWMRTYGSFMKDANQVGEISITERVYSLAAHARMYGMARILNLHEILKFQATNRHDLKYSILANGENQYSCEKISARDGEVTVKKILLDENPETLRTHLMSKRDIGEILFRRRDTDNLITEAFGIPSINGAISLMLD